MVWKYQLPFGKTNERIALMPERCSAFSTQIRRTACGSLIAVLAMCLGPSLWGQSLARLTGSVLDPSGAAVPAIKIVATNVSTGVAIETVTNSQGLFEFPNLALGTYNVSASGSGYELTTRPGIELLTGHVVDVSITLQLAGVTSRVSVNDTAPILQTSSSQLQTSINEKSMTDLPLNGRNALQLITLTPGAATTTAGTIAGQQDNPGISINGLRATDNNYLLDGVSYLNKHFDSAPTLPNPDTLKEFTVQASNFSARESGGGAVVEMATRSGTDSFHGIVFDYLRNDALDARNFFAVQKVPFHRNQFGGTVGGPIIKNRTFFFGSYQGTRTSGGASPQTVTVPSLQDRTGDFSSSGNVIIDPLTGAPFAGNAIPQQRVDPLAAKVLALVPLPNSGLRRLVGQPLTTSNEDQYMVRIDHSFGERDQLAGRYFNSHLQNASGNLSFPGATETNDYRNQSATIFETHVFNPAFSMTSSFGYSRNFRLEVPETPASLQGFGANIPTSVEGAPPALSVGVNGFFNMGTNGVYLAQEPQTYDGHVAFFRSQGRHFLQFGADVDHDTEFASAIYNQSGVFTFDGSRTGSAAIPGSGSAMADFLLGLPLSMSQVAEANQNPHQTEYQFWFQDDWKVNSRFTLNLGLRWEPWLPATDGDGALVGFVPGVQSTVAPLAPNGLIFSGDPGYQRSIFKNDWKNLAPRVGFAWTPSADQKTVLRGGFGIFYRGVPLNIQRYIGEGAPFRSLLYQVNNPPSFADPYANTPGGSPYPFSAPSESEITSYQFPSPTSGRALDPSVRSSYTEEWSILLERQLRGDIVVSASYVGNQSVGIIGETEANPGIYGPGATTGNLDSRRPYHGFGSIEFVTGFGHATYNALQLNFSKRLSHGLQILANYTYSKTIDNNSAAAIGGLSIRDPFDLNADRGPADFDQTHRFNLSYVYDLPKFTSRRALGEVINGWQWNGIVAAASGLPFTVKSGRDNSFSGVNSDNADLIGNAARPAGVNTVAEFFNTTAFAQNVIGTFGSVGRNSLRGPDSINFDTSLFKGFALRENIRLEFRAEAFNILNHARFYNPDTVLTSPTVGQILSAQDPRVVQLALKLIF